MRSFPFRLTMVLAIACSPTAVAESRFAFQGSLTSAVWLRENARSAVDAKNTSDPNNTSATFFQYLRLSTSRLSPNPNGTRAQFYLSGRWMNGFDGPSSVSSPEVSDDFRLHEAYLDIASTHKRRFRIGRQFLPNAVAFWELDGALWQERRGVLTSTVYGGSAAPSWQFDESTSRVVGGQMELRATDRARARFGAMASFAGIASDGDAVYVFGGFDAATASPLAIHPTEQPRASASADIAYEPQMSRVARASGAARLDTARLSVTADVRHDTPSFPADSIFRVFAVEPTREASLGVETRPVPWLAVNGRVARQSFDAGSASRKRVETVVYDAYEPVARVGVEWLDWEGRSRRNVYFRAQRQMLSFLTLGVGSAVNAYRYADASNAFSRATEADARVRFNANWRLLARVERSRNRDYRAATRVLAWLQTSFAATNGREP